MCLLTPQQGVINCDLAGSAMQDFNIEKLQLLESEKAKIRKEYERREGQIEVKKKMWAPPHPSKCQPYVS